MATRFEVLLDGSGAAHLRAAGEEAVATIQRLEAQLSFYRATSDVGRVNANAAREPVRVGPELFHLLVRARELNVATDGMFDITVGPLMRCWRFSGGSGAVPDAAALEAARQCVGMQLVELDEARRTVRFARPGVEIDLGGIAKGYALEETVAVLREAGVERALLHGGTSSVYGMGSPAAGGEWKVAIEYPPLASGVASPRRVALPHGIALAAGDVQPAEPADTGDGVLAVVTLRDQALSVSAVRGRWFEVDGAEYGHVMDPSLGRPVAGALLAAAVCDSATDADAMATALLALGPSAAGARARRSVAADTLVVARGVGDLPYAVRADGIEVLPWSRP
jgi:FAD:protein FMN transferase